MRFTRIHRLRKDASFQGTAGAVQASVGRDEGGGGNRITRPRPIGPISQNKSQQTGSMRAASEIWGEGVRVGYFISA